MGYVPYLADQTKVSYTCIHPVWPFKKPLEGQTIQSQHIVPVVQLCHPSIGPNHRPLQHCLPVLSSPLSTAPRGCTFRPFLAPYGIRDLCSVITDSRFLKHVRGADNIPVLQRQQHSESRFR